MPYQVIVNTENNVTLKHIADSNGIEYQKGKGFYELTKNESIACKKELVLYENGNYMTDSLDDIRNLCGFPSGDLNISSTDLPPNMQLFVQSTAPNRKIPVGVAVLFYVDGPVTTNPSAPTNRGKKQIQYAIKYDLLLSDDVMDHLENGDLDVLFNIPVGVDFSDCDRAVPMQHQLPSLWFLSNLTRTQWDDVDIHVTKMPYITNDRVDRVSATGKLTYLDESSGNHLTDNVRLEYLWQEEWSCYAVSVGMQWGALVGSCGCHPFVVTPQFNYGNSDGSSSEMPPIAICECSEKNALAAATTAGSTNSLFDHEIRVSNQQKLDSICGHLLRTFSTHCADSDH